MTSVVAPPHFSASNMPQMRPSEFAAIADYAKSTFGLHLPPAKQEMVYARLIKRLRRVGIQDFTAYLTHVKQDNNLEERSEFLSALTTNVTQFFRENHHFEFLRKSVLPALIAKARAGKRIRFWSAGCSAGQEPYSLAMVILDMCPEAASLDIKILASDIDSRILSTAKSGQYQNDQREAIPNSLQRFITQSAAADSFSIVGAVRDLITFAELNLMEDWPMRGGFDAIFCRNVAIYFDAATQATLWHRFEQQMTASGYLFIGHSERLLGPATTKMRGVGITVYAKNSTAPEFK
jgi:chemotaxis protein methyltransferase CheR